MSNVPGETPALRSPWLAGDTIPDGFCPAPYGVPPFKASNLCVRTGDTVDDDLPDGGPEVPEQA